MPTQAALSEAVESIRQRKYEEAAKQLTEIRGAHPGNEQAGWLLLQCREQLRERDRAAELLQELLQQSRGNLNAINRLAGFAQQRGYPLDGVLQAFRDHLEQYPGAANAAFNLAWYLGKDGQFQAAIETYRRAIRLGVKSPEEAQLNIANIYMDHLHDHEKAAQHFQEARSLNPRYAPVYHNMGNLAEQLGDRIKAARYFQKCLELQPDNDLALARLADTHQFTQAEDPLLNRMVVAALTSSSPDLHFSLGRAFEQVGDHGRAWQHFAQANAMDARSFPRYEPARMEALFERIATTCDADWLSRFGGESSPTVFICGLFRTGSTLLEQVLGIHPAFTAGGESDFFPRLLARRLPRYPEDVAPLQAADVADWRAAHEQLVLERTGGQERLTDKRPDNFLFAGLIKAVLPSARFIVTERDWRDTACSIFGTRLGRSQHYATRLEHIGHYIGLHRRLVDHWEALLGDDLLRVRYEDLVMKPEETLETLLNWLGEDWDDRCLRFHEQKGAVKTASVWQVREPLHTRSVGRWRNYAGPFEQAFGAQR